MAIDIMFHLMQHALMTLNEYFAASPTDKPAELAARVGLSAASMSRARKGWQNLSLDTISAIVRETGGKVTADDLRAMREAA
jgi:DNA-binding transcriptional regulator YdaS (Cro superfamily)